MRTTSRFLALASSLLMAGTLLVLTQAPASAATHETRVSVYQSHRIQQWPKPVTFRGQVQAQNADGSWGYIPGESGTIRLQRRLEGTSAWRTVGTDTTAGNYSFSTKAIQNADYRLLYGGGTYNGEVFTSSYSKARPLLVRRNLNDYFVDRSRVYLKGNVNPGWAGKIVKIQRKTCNSCAYSLYTTVRTDSEGRFVSALPARRSGSYYYRALVQGTEAYAASPGNTVVQVYLTYGRTGARMAG